MFRVSQHPSSGALKTVTATSGIGHNTGIATSFQRGLIRTPKTVTATSGIGHNTGTATSFQRGLIRTPDQITLEGRSYTSVMTYTRGSGYSF